MEMGNLTAEANWEYILHVSNPSSQDEGEQPRAAGCLHPGNCGNADRGGLFGS